MIYLQKMLYDGDGRKTPKYKNENKEKILHLVTLLSSRLQNGGQLFSGAQKHRKQAGSTLSWVRYGQLIADNMIFINVKFQDLQQKRARVRFEVQKQ